MKLKNLVIMFSRDLETIEHGFATGESIVSTSAEVSQGLKRWREY